MERIISVADALRCAVQTAQEQPREVPAAPAGWRAKAQAALDNKNHEQVQACASEILSAHSQYRAEFDVKGWLFDLRNAVRKAPAHAAASAALVNVIARTKEGRK
jgi:hypothetical protein